MTYGTKVRMLRSKLNMTMDEYSRKLKLSKTSLSRIENEEHKRPPIKQLRKIADYHKLPIEYFTTTQYDRYTDDIVRFLNNPDAKKYIIRAYYAYKSDTILNDED